MAPVLSAMGNGKIWQFITIERDSFLYQFPTDASDYLFAPSKVDTRERHPTGCNRSTQLAAVFNQHRASPCSTSLNGCNDPGCAATDYQDIGVNGFFCDPVRFFQHLPIQYVWRYGTDGGRANCLEHFSSINSGHSKFFNTHLSSEITPRKKKKLCWWCPYLMFRN